MRVGGGGGYVGRAGGGRGGYVEGWRGCSKQIRREQSGITGSQQHGASLVAIKELPAEPLPSFPPPPPPPPTGQWRDCRALFLSPVQQSDD